MRPTYTSVKGQFADNIGQPGFTDSTLSNFFDRSLGQRYQLILAELSNHKTQSPPQTASTVANQQHFHYAQGDSNVEAVTLTIGSMAILPKVVDSPLELDRLNELTGRGFTA